MKYCIHCGKELEDDAVVCIGCGRLVEVEKKNEVKASDANNTLGTVAKVFAIISCVFMGLWLIPLAWTIPMTVSLSKKLKNNEPISTGFKVCTLLFLSLISGILLLCMNND